MADDKDAEQSAGGTNDTHEVIDVEDIQNHILELLNNPPVLEGINHNEIFEQILGSVDEIDFHAEAELDETTPINQKIQVVIVVRKVLEIAAQLGIAIEWWGNSVYRFNGHYWKAFERPELELFLGRAAAQLGVDPITAEHHRFRTNLVNQFYSTAYAIRPPGPEGTIPLNVANGTYEIRTTFRILRPPDARDYLTYQLQFPYVPEAVCPKWQAHLDRVVPDPASQRVLSEYFAYIFTDLKLEKALLLWGSGANGKSVVFDVLTALLGPENISHYSLQNLANEYHRACIADKLLNYCSEISSRIDCAVFKQLASSEPIAARLPYGKPFTMHKYAKLAVNCNELPRDVEHNHAFFRRLLIIPFNVTIAEDEQNPNLAREIIREELSGIFNWLLQGLDRLLCRGKFSDCAASSVALEVYRKETDTVALFLDENGYVATFERSLATPLQLLYSAYKDFNYETGGSALNRSLFMRQISSLGYKSIKTNKGKLVYLARTKF